MISRAMRVTGMCSGMGGHGSRNYDEGPRRGEKDAVYDV